VAVVNQVRLALASPSLPVFDWMVAERAAIFKLTHYQIFQRPLIHARRVMVEVFGC
jgi:hypothetical protein